MLLRQVALGRPSLYIDEAFSISDGWNLWSEVSQPEADKRPLAYLIVRLFLRIFGWNVPAARLGPCLVGAITIPILYGWVRLRLGRFAGCVASLLLLVSPWHHFLSQSARYYTLVILLGLCVGVAFERWLRRGSWWWLLLTALSLALIASTQASGILVLAGLLLFCVIAAWIRPLDLPPRILRQLRILLWALPVVALAMAWILSGALEHHYGNKAGFGTATFIKSLGWHAGISLLVLAGCSALWAWIARCPLGLFASCMWIGVLTAAGGASFIVIVNHQYVTLMLPFLCAGIAAMADQLRRRFGLLVALTVLAAPVAEGIGGIILYHASYSGYRADWRSAAAYTLAHVQPGDLIATNQTPVLEFYLNPANRNLRDARAVLGLSMHTPASEQLRELMHRPGRVWYLIEEADLVKWHWEDRASFLSHLRDHCRLQREYPLMLGSKNLGVKIYLQGRR